MNFSYSSETNDFMTFMDRHGWHCQFREADLKTPLPRKLHFTSPDKIVELAERRGGFPDQESRLMLEAGIGKGRGGMYVMHKRYEMGQICTCRCRETKHVRE